MRFSFVVAGCIALVGCKGKPEHREAPANAHVASNGHHADIKLPKGDGSPPKKTTGHLSPETIAKLRALEYPRFVSENHGNDQSVAVLYRTDDRPKLKVTVQIRPCDVGTAKCLPLELDKWKGRDDLKEFLPTELQAKPDTTFEVGATELNGVPMIYTYQVGMGGDDKGAFMFSDTYVLYYNDGVNEIRAIAAYADDKPLSRDAMLKMASEETLSNIAKAFVDVFTQAWG